MKLIIFILNLVIYQGVFGDSINLEFTSHAKLNFDKQTYQITNTTYKVVPYYPNGDAGRMLVEQITSLTENVGKEGREAFTNLKAYDVFFGDSTRLLWEIEDYGEEIEYTDNYVKFISHGCCSALPTYIFYDLYTGKFLMHTTSSLIVHKNGDDESLIGFYHPEAFIQAPEYPETDSLKGVLSLLVNDSATTEVHIYSNELERELSPSFGVLRNNIVYLHYGYGKNIEIPFDSNGFNLDQIKNSPNDLKFIEIVK